jgi:DNA-binding CsgD family transcriptional regulator
MDHVTAATGALALGRGAHALLESRRDARQRILFTAPFPAGAEGPLGVPPGAGVVWILDCEVEPEIAEKVSRLFALSKAETRLLRELVRLQDLRLVSETLGVSIHTARAQLKNVLHKTGRRSQVELLKLVARASALRWR